jgi:hypothetical protein
MHASEGALPRVEGNITLHEVRVHLPRLALSLTPDAGKETTLVLMSLRRNDKRPGYAGLSKSHE